MWFDFEETGIRGLDLTVNARALADLKDFGKIYYETAATIVPFVGALDTGVRTWNVVGIKLPSQDLHENGRRGATLKPAQNEQKIEAGDIISST